MRKPSVQNGMEESPDLLAMQQVSAFIPGKIWVLLVMQGQLLQTTKAWPMLSERLQIMDQKKSIATYFKELTAVWMKFRLLFLV
jgi:hypothetical protein